MILLMLGVAAVLLAATAVFVHVTVDGESFRGYIENRAETALDREVDLGVLRLSFLPVFGLEVEDVSLAARPTEGRGEIRSGTRSSSGGCGATNGGDSGTATPHQRGEFGRSGRSFR